MANYNSMISEWIKEKRIEKGWKQEQLGEKVGVTKTAVSYWESGKRSVSAEMFVSYSPLKCVFWLILAFFSVFLNLFVCYVVCYRLPLKRL